MKKILALSFGLLLWIAGPRIVIAQAQLTNIILGHSGGAGLVSDLRRIIEREKIWEKYGLNVKAVYFNSGSVLTQAMAGGNIAASDSDVPDAESLGIRRGRSQTRGGDHQPSRTYFCRPKEHRQPRRPQRQAGGRQPARIGVRHRDAHGFALLEVRSGKGNKLLAGWQHAHAHDRAGSGACRCRSSQSGGSPQDYGYSLLPRVG